MTERAILDEKMFVILVGLPGAVSGEGWVPTSESGAKEEFCERTGGSGCVFEK